MLQKIISGGQTGVDRAALDAAIKLTIPYGGWIPRGRLTEDGPLPLAYHLKETRNTSYAYRTEKNVLAADATLIISRGPLTGGSKYTREMAVKHNRRWLHIDLEKISAFQAAIAINDWITKMEIAVLNVAGPRASSDPQIYNDTLSILESSYYLGLVKGGASAAAAADRSGADPDDLTSRQPQSIEAAVARLISEMPLKDKTTIANMTPDELPGLFASIGQYIITNFGLQSGNRRLIEACRSEADGSFQNDEDAAAVIIDALWQKLRETHKLRLVK